MSDLIDRQAAIDAHCELCDMNDKCICMYCKDIERFMDLPTADLSEYCDKLWKIAYGRGNAEARVIIKLTEEDKESLKKVMNEAELTLMPAEIIHCKECVYYENEAHGLCDLGGEWAPDDYCSYGRRPKHG